MILLPQFEGVEVVQKTYKAFGNEYHRYQVLKDGENLVPCQNCADCRKGKVCKGLPSVTSITGQYSGGGLYPAGYRDALDAIFGPWKDKVAKNETAQAEGWLFDGSGTPELVGPMHLEPVEDQSVMVNRPSSKDFFNSGMQNFGAYLRKEVESFPTPGEAARDFGSAVHSALESVLKGEGIVPVHCADAVKDVTDWLQRGGADGPYMVEDVEVDVFHPELLVGGQVDCVARCGNRVILIDWKSGKDIYPNHAMQIAAYAMCYEAMTGEEVAEAWIVKSGKHGFDAKQVKDLAPAQKAFIAMQETKKNVAAIEWAKGGE
jgi:hypothetical protein